MPTPARASSSEEAAMLAACGTTDSESDECTTSSGSDSGVGPSPPGRARAALLPAGLLLAGLAAAFLGRSTGVLRPQRRVPGTGQDGLRSILRRDGMPESYPAKGRGTPKPFEPLEHKTVDSTADFPKQPPTALAPEGHPPPGPTLAGGPITREVTDLHLQRQFWSLTGHDLTVANHSGSYVYATRGNFWSMHSRTHIYDAKTGARFAQVERPIVALHTTYEVATYEPICSSQTPYDHDEGLPLYNFARLTQAILTVYPHWTLERYGCDGSLTTVWDIKSREWASLRTHFDFFEPKNSKPVGSVDQTYYVSANQYYDAWITKGEDLRLFAVTSLMIDMNILSDEQSSASNGKR